MLDCVWFNCDWFNAILYRPVIDWCEIGVKLVCSVARLPSRIWMQGAFDVILLRRVERTTRPVSAPRSDVRTSALAGTLVAHTARRTPRAQRDAGHRPGGRLGHNVRQTRVPCRMWRAPQKWPFHSTHIEEAQPRGLGVGTRTYTVSFPQSDVYERLTAANPGRWFECAICLDTCFAVSHGCLLDCSNAAKHPKVCGVCVARLSTCPFCREPLVAEALHLLCLRVIRAGVVRAPASLSIPGAPITYET